MKYKYPFIKPILPNVDEIAKDYISISNNNWYTNFGPFERTFRSKVADYIGNGVSVATVANATLGLDISIKILFKKDNTKNKVIIPSFTFAAGPQVLISNGFKPVLIDIDENLQPDISQAGDYIDNNNDVVGIMLCNTFGVGNVNIKHWEDLARKNGLPLIIDSAAGFGSEYSPGERLGARGDCEIFSFHATKPFGIGEGGAVSSKNEELVEKLNQSQNFGFDANKEPKVLGTNAKMQEFNAAIGIRKLARYDKSIENRRRILGFYKSYLDKENIHFQNNDSLSSVPFVNIIADSALVTKEITQRLHESRVEVKRYYAPIDKSKFLNRYCEVGYRMSKTNEVSSKIIALPVHDDMTKKDINYITKAIKQ